MTTDGFFQDLNCVPDPDMSPVQWLHCHRLAGLAGLAPRDSRIPAYMECLARELCTLRFSLEQLRLALIGKPERIKAFTRSLSDNQQIPLDTQGKESLISLIEAFLSRVDWRELDVLEMMLEYLGRIEDGCLLGDDSGRRASERKDELVQFEALRTSDPQAYRHALDGLMSEAKGSLAGLMMARKFLMSQSVRFAELNEEGLRLLVVGLGIVMGIPLDFFVGAISLPQEPEELWNRLIQEADRIWSDRGIPVSLKPLERASVYLLECLPVEKAGHAAFVRHLIEREDAYRAILSSCYAPRNVQMEHLGGELARYNMLPEYAAKPLELSDDEMRIFLYAFMLRPDVIAAIAEREEHKDIYRAIPGLSSRAHLPRVLHEVQNIFGYVTPEAVERIVDHFQIDPVDVIRLIASYKQFSADRGGDIIIYVCKGTACFLRGQPELSRKIADEIMADEGQVGKGGVQFIEMDCFGVCHLAPVIKTRDTFLGRRKAEDIPMLLDQLMKGPSYENRIMFLDRIRRMLAPGHQSDPIEELRIKSLTGDASGGSNQPLISFPEAHEKGYPIQDSDVSGKTLEGACLQISDTGHVFAHIEARREFLGRLVTGSLCFHFSMPDGRAQLGALILDHAGQVQMVVRTPFPFAPDELNRTMKPRAYVEGNMVWVDRFDGPFPIGDYSANAMVVEDESGGYRLIELSGPPTQAPPEREEGLKVRGAMREAPEEKDFLKLQDRLLLGFSSAKGSENIDAYVAQGGYHTVRRVLGLEGEDPWNPEAIIGEIAAARLRGRGGAGFPTGRKWDGMRQATCTILEKDENQDRIKLIVANGDEGDPGAFMDRTLIQERPHQILEGMLIAAIAVGARYGVIYVRKEYEDAVRRLENAIFQARRKGYLGRNIFGVEGLHFDVDIRLGAGAFVAGEKRAIMRAIEGQAAEPTLNAPSNTQRGLWGKPTLLNNVETFANVPLILHRGASWYAAQGTGNTGGSKIFSVAGIVKHTGLVEVRFGRTLQDIIHICGGIQEGKRLAGVQIGGPSGAILSLTGIRSYLLHTPLDFDAFDDVGAMLGSGGLVFIGEDDDVVRLARHFTDWLAEESCGQCPACFQGARSLGVNLDIILHGEGISDHIHALWAKSDAIKAGSQCGLGMTASNPVTSALRFFPHAFLRYLLSNPRLEKVELFKSLEALRLITRENVERISKRRREIVGYSFSLKKHLMRNLVLELDRLDQVRPFQAKQKERFLDLLEVPEHEVGARDVMLERSLNEAVHELRSGRFTS